MNEVALLVDGVPLESVCVNILPQKDPYPGGCKYSITLPIDARQLKILGLNGSIERVSDEKRSKELLHWIGALMPKGQGETKYLLNNVTVVENDGKRVCFSGVCSLLMR